MKRLPAPFSMHSPASPLKRRRRWFGGPSTTPFPAVDWVHTDDLRRWKPLRHLRIYRELAREGIRFRTHHLIYHPHLAEAGERGIRAGDGDEWVTVGGVKIFADGSLGGRTALLSRPYHDDPGRTGMEVHSRDELLELVAKARQ